MPKAEIFQELTQMIAKSRFNPYKKTEKAEFSEREKEIIAGICDEEWDSEGVVKIYSY